MLIKQITENKKEFLELLLMADEQEDMVDKYLEHGDMFALYDSDLKSICVITNEGDGVYELKNIATFKKYQRCGYGKYLIEHLFKHYGAKCKLMFVGTGDVPDIISFYENCGFSISHRVKNFFTDNYNHPIYENGVQLIDMVYLKR